MRFFPKDTDPSHYRQFTSEKDKSDIATLRDKVHTHYQTYRIVLKSNRFADHEKMTTIQKKIDILRDCYRALSGELALSDLQHNISEQKKNPNHFAVNIGYSRYFGFKSTTEALADETVARLKTFETSAVEAVPFSQC